MSPEQFDIYFATALISANVYFAADKLFGGMVFILMSYGVLVLQIWSVQ